MPQARLRWNLLREYAYGIWQCRRACQCRRADTHKNGSDKIGVGGKMSALINRQAIRRWGEFEGCGKCYRFLY